MTTNCTSTLRMVTLSYSCTDTYTYKRIIEITISILHPYTISYNRVLPRPQRHIYTFTLYPHTYELNEKTYTMDLVLEDSRQLRGSEIYVSVGTTKTTLPNITPR